MTGAITKPQLPPKKGYVEIINKNGKHVYKATADGGTEKRLRILEENNSYKEDDMAAMLVDLEYRTTLLELNAESMEV